MTRFLGFLLLMFLIAACGRKGPLVKPEALVPEKVRDFKVRQKVDHLLFSWTIPGKLVSGGKLTDLSGFRLFIRNGLMDGAGCQDCLNGWKQEGSFDLEYLQGAVRIGSTLYYSTPAPPPGVERSYRIIAYTKSQTESQPSDLQFTGRESLSPPVVNISPTYATLAMEFIPPPLPEGYHLTGYSIYRSLPGEPVPMIPYATVASGNRFEESRLEMGIRYSWKVTVNAVKGQDAVEGLPAEFSAGVAEPEW